MGTLNNIATIKQRNTTQTVGVRLGTFRGRTGTVEVNHASAIAYQD